MEEKQDSCLGDDSEMRESEDIIINEVDGLPNMHPNLQQLELELERERERDHEDPNYRTLEDILHDEDLPTSVIVTNVDPKVFKCDKLKVPTSKILITLSAIEIIILLNVFHCWHFSCANMSRDISQRFAIICIYSIQLLYYFCSVIKNNNVLIFV